MRNLLVALMVASSVLGTSQRSSGQEVGATVEVQNNLEDNIEVYVNYDRFDRRIGTVDALATTELSLPAGIVRGPEQPIQLFVAHDGTDLATRSFEVSPGETIGLRVPSDEPADGEVLGRLPAEMVSEATLTVENHRSTEVVVFAEEEPLVDVRLGVVAPDGRETLEFPPSVVGPNDEITVVIEPRDGTPVETRPLDVTEGQHLLLRLMP